MQSDERRSEARDEQSAQEALALAHRLVCEAAVTLGEAKKAAQEAQRGGAVDFTGRIGLNLDATDSLALAISNYLG